MLTYSYEMEEQYSLFAVTLPLPFKLPDSKEALPTITFPQKENSHLGQRSGSHGCPANPWFPAHANIPLNEMADKSVNEAATEAKNESSLEAIPLSKATAFKIVNDIVKRDWQRQ